MARLGLGLAHFATDHGNDKTALAKVKLHVWYDSERRRPAIRTPEVDASPLANFFSLVPDPSAWHAGFGSSTLFEDLWDIFGVHFLGLILGFAMAACLFSPIPSQVLLAVCLFCDNVPIVDWCISRDDLAPPSSG